MKSKSVFALLAAAVVTVCGCDPSTNPFGNLAGDYSGVMSLAAGSGANAAPRQESARGQLTSVSDHELSLQLTGGATGTVLTADVKWDDGGNVTLTESATQTTLQFKQADGNCFSDAQVSTGGASLCVQADEIIFGNRAGASGLLGFDVQKDNPASTVTLETPANYTIDLLLDRVQKDNFSSRIEFEKYVQAKLNYQNDALNMIPHFNVNDLLNVLSLNLVTIAKSIGDFAPFLFPEKWLDTQAADWQQQAEKQSWISMTLDSAQIVEGLCYSIARDEQALTLLALHREDIVKIRDIVLQREHTGLMQIGSSDDINAVVNSVDEAVVLLQQGLDTEYTALAQASGFNNPHAISRVDGVPAVAPPVQAPDETALIPVVLQAAPELRQLQDLVESAGLETTASYFSWMDPSGNAQGVSFALGTTIQIAQSNEQEMTLERDQLKTVLSQKTSDAIGAEIQVLGSLQNGLQGTAIQQRSVDRLTKNLTQGLNFTMSDLVTALKGLTQSDLQASNSQYGVMIAQSQLNRLMLAGIYGQIAQNAHPF